MMLSEASGQSGEVRALSNELQEQRRLSDSINPCSSCGTPPAASIQVGGGDPIFWFECKTCGRKTEIRKGFPEARQEWNSLQSLE
jgi:ribosomal protein S14